MTRAGAILLAIAICACGRQAESPAQLTGSEGDRCEKSETVVLDVPLDGQDTDEWCWAAVGRMVMLKHKRDTEECEMANIEGKRKDCCPAYTTPDACLAGGWPPFTTCGVMETPAEDPVKEGIIRGEIDHGRPLAYAWRTRLGIDVGHMVVIAGYTVVGNEMFLVIHDPWPRGNGMTRLIPFREYAQSSSSYHWKTLYNLEKTTNAVEQSDCRHRDFAPL